MNLRHCTTLRRPPLPWWTATLALAACLGALGLGPSGAGAGIADYPSPIYLSSAMGIGSTYQLTTSAGPAAPTTAPTVGADTAASTMNAKYAYEYTIVDPRGGETAPSPASSPDLTVANKAIDVNGLPVGSTVRLYRACSSGTTCTPSTKATLYYRVAQFTVPATSPQYVDTTPDATIITNPNIMPQTQNRPTAGQIGYYKFVPGVALLLKNATTAPVGSPVFSGEGWVVANAGGVRFAAGTWTFTARFSGMAGANNAASLDVGMWIVDDTGAKVGGPIIDPTGAGDDTSTNIAQVATTVNPVTATVANVPAFDVKSNQHLYVQFWRHQTQSNSSTITTLYSSDGVTPTIGHPVATSVPDAPSLLAPTPDGLRTSVTTPQLKATYTDGDVHTGTLTFQVCTATPCNTASVSHTTGPLASNTTATWNTPALPDGTYYWNVQATDTVNNTTTWSLEQSFTVDTTPPSAPALVSPAAAVRTNQTTPPLTATFSDTPAGGTGTISFQLCPPTGPCTSGTASGVANGSNGSWTPPSALADQTYTWKAQATDSVGNVSAWSSTHSFVLDTNPPPTPALVAPADGASLGGGSVLTATFSSSDVGDNGSIKFQVCTTSACSTVVASGSSAGGLLSGKNGSWSLSGLPDGSYWWRAQALDAAGNTSTTPTAWTTARSFAYDGTPPTVTATAPASGLNSSHIPALTATYSDAHPDSLTFQVCPTNSCTSVAATTTFSGLAASATETWIPSLSNGTYYWRVRGTDSFGNTSNWSAGNGFRFDNTPPRAPVLQNTDGMRTRTAPVLSARIDDPGDPGDSARLLVEVCVDPGCGIVTFRGYSAAVPVGSVASVQAPPAVDGTYYWQALAEDAVGNQSAWSPTRSFVVDTVAPTVPLQGGVSEAALVSRPRLSGTFSDADPGDSGTLEFQVCSDADCATVVADGSSASVAASQTGSWTVVDTLDDGVYFWRVRAVDEAGNPSAWSSTRSFTLDRTPPGRPQDFSAHLSGQVLTLRWRPPAGTGKVRGYALIVNGKRTRTLDPKTLKVRIHLLKHDTRSFAVAAIDTAGNMSAATRTIATLKPPLSLKQARSAALRLHR